MKKCSMLIAVILLCTAVNAVDLPTVTRDTIVYEYTQSSKTAAVKLSYTGSGTSKKNVKIAHIKDTLIIDSEVYTVTSIKASSGTNSYGFKGNTDLVSVNIPASITSIGKEAFSGCSKLKSIVIGDNVIEIGDQSFKNCNNMTTAVIASGALGRSVFYGCSKLASVTLGEGVTIADASSMFYNCSALADIELNMSAIPTSLCNSVSSLKRITLGEKVSTIGDNAFYVCTAVESVTCLASVPPTVIKDHKEGMTTNGTFRFKSNVDKGNRDGVSLTVPYDYMNVYAATDVWEDFSPLRGTGTGNLYDGKESPTVYDETVQNGRLSTWKTMATPMNVCLHRSFEGDGGYYSICLPFGLTAEQLAESPFADDELLTLTEVKDYSGTLCFILDPVSSISAGKPYLLKVADGQMRTNPVFEGVTISLDATADDEARTTVATDAKFIGILKPTHIDDEDHKVLFLSSGTTLTWATDGDDSNAKMGGFRAYFRITTDNVPQGMPARIMMREEAPSGLQAVSDEIHTTVRKYISGGRMVIEREGRRYDITGREL